MEKASEGPGSWPHWLKVQKKLFHSPRLGSGPGWEGISDSGEATILAIWQLWGLILTMLMISIFQLRKLGLSKLTWFPQGCTALTLL